MARTLGLIYGWLCYLVGFGSLAYAMGFLNNIVVPRTIDAGPVQSLPVALAINVGLAALFAVQHSVMARASFKARWTRIIPAFAERSTYVLFSGLVLVALYAFWSPMPTSVWHATNSAVVAGIYGLQVLGWAWLIASTFMLSHGELFGLQQVHAWGRGEQPTPMRFRMPGFYRIVRHPIQVGVLVTFWATPHMSQGRLLLCIGITGYIVVALKCFEERDLVRTFGSTYRAYQRKVGMLFPRLRTSEAPQSGSIDEVVAS